MTFLGGLSSIKARPASKAAPVAYLIAARFEVLHVRSGVIILSLEPSTRGSHLMRRAKPRRGSFLRGDHGSREPAKQIYR
jgi:hypothetical protein